MTSAQFKMSKKLLQTITEILLYLSTIQNSSVHAFVNFASLKMYHVIFGKHFQVKLIQFQSLNFNIVKYFLEHLIPSTSC